MTATLYFLSNCNILTILLYIEMAPLSLKSVRLLHLFPRKEKLSKSEPVCSLRHFPCSYINSFAFWRICFYYTTSLRSATRRAVRFDHQLSYFSTLGSQFVGARSEEMCWASRSQQLIIVLLLQFLWCIWGQLLPVCASAFLSTQCELSQSKQECTPGRRLPPHQTCPLPLPSRCLSLTMIHTQHELSSCPLFFFSLFNPSRSF